MSDLPVVSGVIIMPLPDANVSVSVLLPAEKVVFPTVMFLKMFCALPGLLLVMVRPLMLIPVPAVKERAPV